MRPKLSQIAKDVNHAVANVTGFANRVHAVEAPQGTSFPYATFQRDGVVASGSKDGMDDMDVTFSINVYSATYYSGVDLMDEVIDNILRITSEYGLNYSPQIENCSEGIGVECFVQTVTFSL